MYRERISIRAVFDVWWLRARAREGAETEPMGPLHGMARLVVAAEGPDRADLHAAASSSKIPCASTWGLGCRAAIRHDNHDAPAG